MAHVTFLHFVFSHHFASSRLRTKMNRALRLEEIVTEIVSLCDAHTLTTFACTCRALSEAALDKIWEDPPIWQLAQLMCRDSWMIIETPVQTLRTSGAYKTLVSHLY
jgi:hypothetical protein